MNVSPDLSEASESSNSLESSIPETPEPTTQSKSQRLNPNVLAAFTSTFVTIVLAEMGDKTQVTTLLMAAQSHQPWIVFLGAATALICTSLVGVLVGRWLARRLSP
ncbi:MAG: TMEM165/GDT1 family protein, partial [Geitlerinemataceae cyanobacterium]